MEPKHLRWHMWMVYVRAWWGQRAKMLKKHRFYCYFLKGQEGHEGARKNNDGVSRAVWEGVGGG